MDPQRQLLDHLADRRLLLVLDNFEQLLGDQEGSGGRGQETADGAGLLVEILRAWPGIKLLVTSRERPNLRDEWLLPLGGLALPPDDTDVSLQSMGYAPQQSRTSDMEWRLQPVRLDVSNRLTRAEAPGPPRVLAGHKPLA